MTVKEVMERLNINETGRAVAYIKDGLEEIEMYTKENVLSGSRASVTANTISLSNQSDILNQTTWSGASGATEPTGWTEYESESLTDMHFDIVDNKLKMTAKDGILPTHRIGMYKSVTLVPGLKYKLSIDSIYNDLGLSVDIGESAPSGLTIASQMFSQIDNGDFDLSITGTHTADFVATAATAYITIYSKAGMADTYTTIDNVVISQYSTIRDTASGFSNFSTDMKLRVVDSTSNDTDESANTSTGYYTINNVYNNEYISLTDTLTDESAGSTITVTGTNQNFMDIIANKRYYPLPNDMLSLIGVKAKNHQNNENKYREIPRMIYKPLEQDADDI